jgi:hypothetical protein
MSKPLIDINDGEPRKGSIVRNASGRASAYTVKHDARHLDRVLTQRSMKDAAAALQRVREARAQQSG